MVDVKSSIKRNLTIPNFLSFVRIIIICPLFVLLLNRDYIRAGVLLVISGVSDMLDGFLARKLDQVTQLGKILDPIADKLTLIAVVISISTIFPVLLPFVIILFSKDALMLLGGAYLLKKHIRPPAARWYGKVATALFYASMITIILLSTVWGIKNDTLTVILLCVTTAAMMFALLNYVKMFVDLLKNHKNNGIKENKENNKENCSGAVPRGLPVKGDKK